MNTRLKKLRVLLNIKQRDFAEKIGIKQGSLSDIERGKVGLSNTNIKLICMLFHVSEDWLRNGHGTPFNMDFSSRKLLDLEKEILFKYNSLNSHDKKAVEQILDSLSNSKNLNSKIE